MMECDNHKTTLEKQRAVCWFAHTVQHWRAAWLYVIYYRRWLDHFTLDPLHPLKSLSGNDFHARTGFSNLAKGFLKLLFRCEHCHFKRKAVILLLYLSFSIRSIYFFASLKFSNFSKIKFLFFLFFPSFFQNYMIPLNQVLSPQEMEAIFVNLEVRIRRSAHTYVYIRHAGVCRAFAWIIQCVYGRASEWRDTLYACMHIRGVMVCKGHSHMGRGGVGGWGMLLTCLDAVRKRNTASESHVLQSFLSIRWAKDHSQCKILDTYWQNFWANCCSNIMNVK